jgi:hypothetical protein
MELTGDDRDTVKRKFFIPAYGKCSLGEYTPLGQVFKKAFPNCWESMGRLKAGQYQELARRMQAVESYLVVWRTCTRLMKEFPDAPLLTLHDSLATDNAHIGAFEAALKEEFEYQYGVTPVFTRKEFLAPD